MHLIKEFYVHFHPLRQTQSLMP